VLVTVDTKVLVRLVTRDDLPQTRRAARLFASHDIFVLDTVLLEAEWVLRHAYGLERPDVIRAFSGILGQPNVRAEDMARLARTLEWYAAGMDFAAALHLAAAHGAFASFDAALLKRARKLAGVALAGL
jgi:predicted nucleic-acid-binding protein